MKTQILQDVAEARVAMQHSNNALRCTITFTDGDTFNPVVATWTDECRDFGKELYKSLDVEEEDTSAYRRRVRRNSPDTPAELTERVCILDPNNVVIGYEPYTNINKEEGLRRVLVGGTIIDVKNINLKEESAKSLANLLKKSTKCIKKKDKEGNIVFADVKPEEPTSAPAEAPAPAKKSTKKSTESTKK